MSIHDYHYYSVVILKLCISKVVVFIRFPSITYRFSRAVDTGIAVAFQSHIPELHYPRLGSTPNQIHVPTPGFPKHNTCEFRAQKSYYGTLQILFNFGTFGVLHTSAMWDGSWWYTPTENRKVK